MVRAASCVVVVTLAFAACSSSDEAPPAPPTEPPAASVTLETVPAVPTSAAVPTMADVTGTAAGGRGVSSIPPLEGAVVPPGTFPPAEALPSVSAGNLRLLGDAPGLEYDVSPDGAWTAAIRSGEICLAPVADPLTANCTAPPAGLGPYTRGSWSAASDAVVVMGDPFSEDAAGVQVIRTDGSVIDVILPHGDVEVPFDALFVDPDRLLVVSLRRDIRATVLTVIDLAAESSGSMGVYTGPDGSPLWLPYATPVTDGDRVVATITRDSAGASGDLEFDIWQFPLDGSPPSILVGTAVRPQAPAPGDLLVPIAVRGDVMLAGFANGRPEFEQQARNGAPVFALIPAAGGDPVVAPNRTDREHRDAELSPDGRYLAVLSFYVGDDNGVRDTALYQLSVASVASILAGEPDWTDLAGLSQAALAGDVSTLGSSIVWTDSGMILLEMSDGVHALELVQIQ